MKNAPLATNSWTGIINAFAKRNAAKVGRPWRDVKVYGSVGDAEGRQSHFYRFNLYYRLDEAFWETVTHNGQELASSSVLSSRRVLVVHLPDLKKML
jgi:hypothetical protein